MEIKSPKRKQSESTRELKTSSFTLQSHRWEIHAPSPYRIPPSTNSHTTKQETSNDTEHDPKMTSNDLKITSNESVKNKKIKLKRGMPDDNPTQGSALFEKVFPFK